MSKESFIVGHRPTKFSEIIGQDNVVASLSSALEDNTSHAYLFVGPSGCGKTTLSRISAKFVGCSNRANLIEVDAATYSGVDDFRNLTEGLKYRPLGGTIKAVIIDEAHALSKQAWASALKMVEEPPEWVYWFFCTTEAAKVPDTIKSRCSTYTLNPVKTTELLDFLQNIIVKEKLLTPTGILELCAKNADGSPRKALRNLSVCYAAKDRKEAASLIANSDIEEGGNAFSLAKALAAGWGWTKVQPILKGLCESNVNPETVRHTVRSYFTKMVYSSKSEDEVTKGLTILDNFSQPFINTNDGFTPLVIAVGRSIF